MKIVTRKLSKDINGPDFFAVLTEPEFIELGYVWEFQVFDGSGMCVRAGLSKIKSEEKLRFYLNSGMNRLDWEALHGKD